MERFDEVDSWETSTGEGSVSGVVLAAILDRRKPVDEEEDEEGKESRKAMLRSGMNGGVRSKESKE